MSPLDGPEPIRGGILTDSNTKNTAATVPLVGLLVLAMIVALMTEDVLRIRASEVLVVLVAAMSTAVAQVKQLREPREAVQADPGPVRPAWPGASHGRADPAPPSQADPAHDQNLGRKTVIQ